MMPFVADINFDKERRNLEYFIKNKQNNAKSNNTTINLSRPTVECRTRAVMNPGHFLLWARLCGRSKHLKNQMTTPVNIAKQQKNSKKEEICELCYSGNTAFMGNGV